MSTHAVAKPSVRSGQRRRVPWLLVLSLPLVVFLTLPLLAIVLRLTPATLFASVQQQQVVQAVSLSLVTATIATLLAIGLGTPLAYALARHQFRGRSLIDTLIDVPIVLPPAVAGVGLLLAFGRRGIVGSYLESWGIALPFTQAAVVLAQLFVAAPYYVKSARAGIEGLDRELEEAAALDGAGVWQTFRYVSIPLAFPALLSGTVMTWARALGEFGATIIFAGNLPGRTQTMPLAIYIGFELNFNVALTLAVILLAVSFTILFIVKRVLRRSFSTVSI